VRLFVDQEVVSEWSERHQINVSLVPNLISFVMSLYLWVCVLVCVCVNVT